MWVPLSFHSYWCHHQWDHKLSDCSGRHGSHTQAHWQGLASSELVWSQVPPSAQSSNSWDLCWILYVVPSPEGSDRHLLPSWVHLATTIEVAEDCLFIRPGNSSGYRCDFLACNAFAQTAESSFTMVVFHTALFLMEELTLQRMKCYRIRWSHSVFHHPALAGFIEQWIGFCSWSFQTRSQIAQCGLNFTV